MSNLIPDYSALPEPARILGHWLLLLKKPGEALELNPAQIGLGADQIQQNVYLLNRFSCRKYAVRSLAKPSGTRPRAGKRKLKPAEPLKVVLKAVDDGSTRHTEAIRQERIAAIRERAGRMPVWRIAEEIGISENNVRFIAVDNQISINYYRVLWDEQREQELLSLVRQNMSSTEIGKLYGITAGAIEMQLAKMRKRGVEVPARMRGGYRHGKRTNKDGHNKG